MSLLRENRMLFIIILVVLFLIELEIFAVAAMKSGRKSWLQVFDAKGNMIHETDGQISASSTNIILKKHLDHSNIIRSN